MAEWTLTSQSEPHCSLVQTCGAHREERGAGTAAGPGRGVGRAVLVLTVDGAAVRGPVGV